MGELRKTWSHRWFTPKTKTGKSPKHGLGTFAVEPISKGEVVAILGGVVVPRWEINNYRKKLGELGIQIDDDFYICPTSREELEETGVFNHSCDPNVGCADSVKIVAIRYINPGDEITADYAMCQTMIEPFECNCGSDNCRKIIKPDDWKISQLQEKYKEFFSPYIKRKIRKAQK